MFEGLKKKFSNFVDSLANKEKEKEREIKEENKEEVKPHNEMQNHHEPVKVTVLEKTEVPRLEPVKRVEIKREEVKKHEVEEKPKASVSAFTKIKGLVFGQVKISETDIAPFVERLKIDLLQSDVNYEVTEKIISSIRTGLVGKTLSSRDVGSQVSVVIKNSIRDILNKGSSIDLVKTVQQMKTEDNVPYKILFIGPNGAGKTTTMAKIAKLMLNNNLSCVLSASDTFRAAAIEQAAQHAEMLGINVIKGKYGADPASVAFDAIAHATAHGIDVVLIDSAGRQETNKSLLEELKKITRIAKPDMKIFIGESIAGNSLLEQVRAIDQAVKIDGIILTKLDVDSKGGNTLSILGDTTIPILFFGTGERYEDLIVYDPDFVVNNIFGSNS